jgi:hypothetical protein
MTTCPPDVDLAAELRDLKSLVLQLIDLVDGRPAWITRTAAADFLGISRQTFDRRHLHKCRTNAAGRVNRRDVEALAGAVE